MASSRELVMCDVRDRGIAAVLAGNEAEARNLGIFYSTLEEMTDAEFILTCAIPGDIPICSLVDSTGLHGPPAPTPASKPSEHSDFLHTT